MIVVLCFRSFLTFMLLLISNTNVVFSLSRSSHHWLLILPTLRALEWVLETVEEEWKKKVTPRCKAIIIRCTLKVDDKNQTPSRPFFPTKFNTTFKPDTLQVSHVVKFSRTQKQCAIKIKWRLIKFVIENWASRFVWVILFSKETNYFIDAMFLLLATKIVSRNEYKKSSFKYVRVCLVLYVPWCLTLKKWSPERVSGVKVSQVPFSSNVSIERSYSRERFLDFCREPEREGRIKMFVFTCFSFINLIFFVNVNFSSFQLFWNLDSYFCSRLLLASAPSYLCCRNVVSVLWKLNSALPK